MFKKVTQSVIDQIHSGGGLVPVRSIFDHEHFRPLSLVREEKQWMFHRSPLYKWTFHSLGEVLLPGEDDKSTEPLFHKVRQGSTKITVTRRVSDRVDGNISASAPAASAEANAVISLSKEWSITLENKDIPIEEFKKLAEKRKINMNHPLIQQLQKRNKRLYVVYESIETSEETTFKENTEAGAGFKAQFYAMFCAKGSRENKQSITIPKGCTLAFRVFPLVIEDGSWYLDIFSMRSQIEELVLASDGLSRGELRKLEAEVAENCQILPKLSLDVSVILLEAIKAVMRDTNLFRELSEKMEEVLCGNDSCELKTESPELKDLLGILQNSSRQLLLQMAGAIAYILGALDELMEDQLLLLLVSLEEKIVPQQLRLVMSILEHDIENEGSFGVDARLLSFSQEKEQELTLAMLEMSGATLQKDGSVVCKKGACSAIAALCVSLSILSLLSRQRGLCAPSR